VSSATPEKLWLTHEWYRCWWESFAGESRLCILAVWRDDRLVGVAPFMLRNLKIKGLQQKVISFIENGISPRSELIVDPGEEGVVDAICRALRRQRKLWDVGWFKNFEEVETLGEFRSSLSSQRYKYVESCGRQSPYIDLRRSWDEIRGSFGKWLKRNLNRGQRRLTQESSFGLEVLTAAGDLPQGLMTCFDVSNRSWKGKEGVGMTSQTARAEFFKRLVVDRQLASYVRIYLLRRHSECIAFELILEQRGHALALSADYDLQYRKNSPGSVLKSLILQQQIANGVRVYDFDGTLYDYKMYWTDKIRRHSELWIFHSGFRSRALYFAKRWFRSMEEQRASKSTQGSEPPPVE